MSENVQFERLSDKAIIPKRAHDGDAGYDLFSAVNVTIAPGRSEVVQTNISVRLPKPFSEKISVYGRVAGRSGLASKKSVTVGGGVIDSNYTGDIGVILFNHSDSVFSVSPGDRVAQLILEVCMTPVVEEVRDIRASASTRGAQGFGSTGA